MTKQPMHSAPQDGSRILVDAELGSDRPENAINDWVVARWDQDRRAWRLSPFVDGTAIDTANGWLPLSVLGRPGP